MKAVFQKLQDIYFHLKKPKTKSNYTRLKLRWSLNPQLKNNLRLYAEKCRKAEMWNFFQNLQPISISLRLSPNTLLKYMLSSWDILVLRYYVLILYAIPKSSWAVQWARNWLDGHIQRALVQWLRVLMDISVKWCPLGNTSDGIVCTLSKSADDTKLCLSAHLKDGMPAQGT